MSIFVFAIMAALLIAVLFLRHLWLELGEERQQHNKTHSKLADAQTKLELSRTTANALGVQVRTLTEERDQLKNKLANCSIQFQLQLIEATVVIPRTALMDVGIEGEIERLRHRLDRKLQTEGWLPMTDYTLEQLPDSGLDRHVEFAMSVGAMQRFHCQLGETTEWAGYRIQPVDDGHLPIRVTV